MNDALRSLKDLQRGALAVAVGGGAEEVADGHDRVAVFADDFADVGLAHLQLESNPALRFDAMDDQLVGELDDLPDDVLEELFHDPD